jgi:hypothetical protein
VVSLVFPAFFLDSARHGFLPSQHSPSLLPHAGNLCQTLFIKRVFFCGEMMLIRKIKIFTDFLILKGKNYVTQFSSCSYNKMSQYTCFFSRRNRFPRSNFLVYAQNNTENIIHKHHFPRISVFCLFTQFASSWQQCSPFRTSPMPHGSPSETSSEKRRYLRLVDLLLIDSH